MQAEQRHPPTNTEFGGERHIGQLRGHLRGGDCTKGAYANYRATNSEIPLAWVYQSSRRTTPFTKASSSLRLGVAGKLIENAGSGGHAATVVGYNQPEMSIGEKLCRIQSVTPKGAIARLPGRGYALARGSALSDRLRVARPPATEADLSPRPRTADPSTARAAIFEGAPRALEKKTASHYLGTVGVDSGRCQSRPCA